MMNTLWLDFDVYTLLYLFHSLNLIILKKAYQTTGILFINLKLEIRNSVIYQEFVKMQSLIVNQFIVIIISQYDKVCSSQTRKKDTENIYSYRFR